MHALRQAYNMSSMALHIGRDMLSVLLKGESEGCMLAYIHTRRIRCSARSHGKGNSSAAVKGRRARRGSSSVAGARRMVCCWHVIMAAAREARAAARGERGRCCGVWYGSGIMLARHASGSALPQGYIRRAPYSAIHVMYAAGGAAWRRRRYIRARQQGKRAKKILQPVKAEQAREVCAQQQRRAVRQRRARMVARARGALRQLCALSRENI